MIAYTENILVRVGLQLNNCVHLTLELLNTKINNERRIQSDENGRSLKTQHLPTEVEYQISLQDLATRRAIIKINSCPRSIRGRVTK